MLATDWASFEGGLPADLVASAAAISGLYELEPIRLCFLNKILSLTPEDVRRHSPATLPRVGRAPLLVAVGDREGDEYLRQSRALVSAWRAPGYEPRLEVLRDTDHFSIREALGDPESPMIRLIRDTMAAGERARN
jgi:arylformamidase